MVCISIKYLDTCIYPNIDKSPHISQCHRMLKSTCLINKILLVMYKFKYISYNRMCNLQADYSFELKFVKVTCMQLRQRLMCFGQCHTSHTQLLE